MTLTFKAASHKPGELLRNITDVPANATQKPAHKTYHFITQISKQFFIERLPRNERQTSSKNVKLLNGRGYRARQEKPDNCY